MNLMKVNETQRHGGEQVIFKSHKRISYYFFGGLLVPVFIPAMNAFVCIKFVGTAATTSLLAFSTGILFMQMYVNHCVSGSFIITDTQLRIRQSVFLTTETCYPLASIQYCYLEELMGWRRAFSHVYELTVQCKGEPYIYRFYELSEKSIEALESIPVHRGSSAPAENPGRHYVASIWCVASIFNALCLVYLLTF